LVYNLKIYCGQPSLIHGLGLRYHRPWDQGKKRRKREKREEKKKKEKKREEREEEKRDGVRVKVYT
jgi:hypothetical protein